MAHYLKFGFCKGSEDELQSTIEGVDDKEYIDELSYAPSQPRSIIFDFETDTSALTHVPNHVEVDILRIDEDGTHGYEECLTNKLSCTGYGCEDSFCS